MQLRQPGSLSIALAVLSAVVHAVPIQSDNFVAAVVPEENVVWVTETVWPCEAPLATGSIALAAVTGVNSVSRGTAQKKADYDTVPVDGSDNSEAVQQEAVSSSSEQTQSPIVDIEATIPATTLTPDSESTLLPQVIDPSTPSDISEILVYTLVHSTTSSADPLSAPSTKLDVEFTVISFHTPSPIPDPTSKSPIVYNANTTITTPPPVPTMPIILPTYVSSNSTAGNNTCTELGEPEEYSPEEERAYWATATEPSFYYSDYTVLVTVKSTSMVTVSGTAQGEVVATSTTVTTTTASSDFSTDSTATFASSSSTSSGSGPILPFNSSKTYTIAGVSRAAITDPDLTTSETISSSEPTTIVRVTSTTPVPIPTVMDPSEQTISGTIIIYVDETTTTTLGSSTTTITETVAALVTASSEEEYDTTTTTTDIITSTIIVEETANAKVRRRMLVTRS
jgi:hypothetical protein